VPLQFIGSGSVGILSSAPWTLIVRVSKPTSAWYAEFAKCTCCTFEVRYTTEPTSFMGFGTTDSTVSCSFWCHSLLSLTAVVTKTTSWPGFQFTACCSNKNLSPLSAVLARRVHVWKKRSPCRFRLPVTDNPLIQELEWVGVLGNWLRDPWSVMVRGFCKRHFSEPALRAPLTSKPSESIVIPLAFSPNINSDVPGMVIFPNFSATAFVTTTFELAGIVTALPQVGLLAEPPQVALLCQLSRPDARWGHSLRVPD